MRVKINTKEKFSIITPNEEDLSDNIAAELFQTILNFLQTDNKNVVLNLQDVLTIDNDALERLANIQQEFYEKSASFVICKVHPLIEHKLDELELLEVMNITPTEAEAGDIVQMEEIERELMDDEDVEFEN